MGTTTNIDPTPLPAAGWKLTFFDGFDKGFLDRAAWPLVFAGGSANGAYTFQPNNVVVGDGEVTVNSVNTGSGWTSGAFQSGWNGQLYGRYEIRARFDQGQGISGALLLWPTDDQGGAEVDLIETRNAERTLNNITVHGTGAPGNFTSTPFTYDASLWRTYTVDWLPGQLVFYLDGQEIYRTTQDAPAEMMSFGVLGFVNSPSNIWQGGPPDARSPASAGIHVDWVRIYTPESLYPGALPETQYGATAQALRPTSEPYDGAWGSENPAEVARTGVRSHEGTPFAATWNAAPWNDAQVPLVVSAPATWEPGTASRLLYGNFVEVQLDFAAAGATGLAVIATGTQRGSIKTAAGNDTVVWVAHSNPTAGPNNTMTILADGGNDTVVVASVGRSGTDQPFGYGSEWRGDYDGRASVARIDLGTGDDVVMLMAGRGVVNGGAGSDTAVFDGAAARYAVSAQADGSTRVADSTGAVGPSVLYGVERVRFSDSEIAAPGQTSVGSVLDLAPIA